MDSTWIVMAFGVGWLAGRVGLPPLVGYLGAGLLLGWQGYQGGKLLEDLSSLGIILLLFAVGMKIRWQTILRKEVLAVGGIHFVVFSGIALLLMAALGLTGTPGVLMAMGLAFSSTVVTIKLLEARSELGTYHGRIAVGILILQDIIAIAILVYLGSKAVSPLSFLIVLLPILRPALILVLERCGHAELMLLFGIAAALGGAALAKLLGLSPELGGLLVGMSLAGHDRSSELAKAIWGVRELLLVAFFLKIGMMGLPTPNDVGKVALILLLLPVKAYLFFAIFMLMHMRPRTGFVGAVGLASFSEFALIVGAAAADSGHLPKEWVTITGVATLVSMAIVAPLSRNIHSLYASMSDWLNRFDKGSLREEHEPTQLGAADWVIVGMGRTGGGAYKALETLGHKPVGLDADPAKISRSLAKGRRVIYGDAEDPELWRGLGLSKVKGVLLTLPDLEAKQRSVRALRARGYEGVIAATTWYNEEDPVLLAEGIDFIVHPFSGAGEKLAQEAIETSIKTSLSRT